MGFEIPSRTLFFIKFDYFWCLCVYNITNTFKERFSECKCVLLTPVWQFCTAFKLFLPSELLFGCIATASIEFHIHQICMSFDCENEKIAQRIHYYLLVFL